jgi:hypothetical protein
LERLNDEFKKKTAPFEEKKVLLSQINQNYGKIARIASSSTVFSRSGPSKECLLERNLALIKSLSLKLRPILMSTSYYKNGIEKLYDRYNRCIVLKGIIKLNFT